MVIQPEFNIPPELMEALCKPPVLKELKRSNRAVMFNAIGLGICAGAATILAVTRISDRLT